MALKGLSASSLLSYYDCLTPNSPDHRKFFLSGIYNQDNLYQKGDINRQAPWDWEVYKRPEKNIERDILPKKAGGPQKENKKYGKCPFNIRMSEL